MANPQGVTYGSVQINYGLAWQGANSSGVNWNLQLVNTGGGGYSANYNWNFQVPSGNVIASGSSGAGIYAVNNTVFASGQVTVNHDGNGNGYLDMAGYFNWYNGSGTAYQGYTPPRIPLAPPITSITADLIKPLAARLGVEIASYGHGSVAAMRMYYRKLGDVGWAQTSDQNDVGGYNYWAVTGLKPNTTYEFFARSWNNYGDTNDSGVWTFKTQSIAGLVPLLMGIM